MPIYLLASPWRISLVCTRENTSSMVACSGLWFDELELSSFVLAATVSVTVSVTNASFTQTELFVTRRGSAMLFELDFVAADLKLFFFLFSLFRLDIS